MIAKDMFILSDENYYSQEANRRYMSASQFKAFLKCEACALAELNGEYERETTTALLVGSYVDAHFEGTLDLFKAKHPEIFKRDGSLKAEYEQANVIIERIENQPEMMHYFSGEKQKIFTGDIDGVKFKVKIDSFLPDEAIIDGKVMRDFEPIYKPEQGRLPWFEAWGYDIQGAIYQHIVEQNTGVKLPFILNAATKEKEPDLDIVNIDQSLLDVQFENIKRLAPRFHAIKEGWIEPERCEHCDYCRRTKKVTLHSSEDYYD